MFTGIVEETGKVSSIKRGSHSAILSIAANKILEDIHIGDSIAVNGICLTVTSFNKQGFSADVMHETIKRSSLSDIGIGDFVNLERAMPVGGRFGGHIVSGHVDGTGEITYIQRDDNAILYTIKADSKIIRYIVEKGSITVDGMSLTVVSVNEDTFIISAIPHTVEVSILKYRKLGDKVNLEVDIVGKYIEHFLSDTLKGRSYSNKVTSSGSITKDFLDKYGF
ncbi:riboflavin synthase, alpha subunit [[Eubacterium] yurii subsp. margaretiae ATCC 43715]|nr:riboflavin synthase, alpha subunit [[Eubacterium] yurii subsp. margaretiae ATCC 43715]